MLSASTVALLAASYLIGAVPFGYLVGRLKGVDILTAGSGNVGATNVGRLLGRKYGVLVFVLDFLKGAVPVAAIAPAARALDTAVDPAPGFPDTLRVGAAALAFLGHLFPIYLGFRGGKGVATGAGVVAVLVPGPMALAVLTWVVVALSSRTVSLASLAAAGVVGLGRVAGAATPFGPADWPLTAFLLVGVGLTVVKHLPNVRRLLSGTENTLRDGPMRRTLVRVVHVVAVGAWFGGAAFFDFVAAPTIFASFREVVDGGPSDRTAYRAIVPPDATSEDRKALSSALAGSAVGPIFPKSFLMQSVCGAAAFVTALAWWNADGGRRVHRVRVVVLGLAALLVAAAWPLSGYVSQLRLERFDPDQAKAAAAVASFAAWHLVSLALSALTTLLAGVGLGLAAVLPGEPRPAS